MKKVTGGCGEVRDFSRGRIQPRSRKPRRVRVRMGVVEDKDLLVEK
jgi:hypothetical protein